MKDPYQVLGVPYSATDEEIKTAYRNLARKYHPDKYRDSDLADIAEEKMKEINEAYDAVKKQRASGGKSVYGTGNTGFGYGAYRSTGYSQENRQTGDETNGFDFSGRTYTTSELYRYVRQFINARRTVEAENILNGIPQSQRSAEWYFLKGCVAVRYRYFVDAQQYFDTACSMEPENEEYRAEQTRLREQMKNNDTNASLQGGCCDSLCTWCTCLTCGSLCCGRRH